MPSAARLGDLHVGVCDHGDICCPHNVSGPIAEGSNNVMTNGKPQARLGDSVTHNCPHCGTGNISEGSGTVFANGKPIARVGDKVTYPGGVGTIVEGSPNVVVGG